MIANYVLKSGKGRVLIVTHEYLFDAPDPFAMQATKGAVAIWDRRHEGLVNGIVVLDPHFDHIGEDFDENTEHTGKVIAGVFLPVYQVAFDAAGAPGTYTSSTTPPAPSPEFQAAAAELEAKGKTIEEGRAKLATRGG